MGAVLLSLIDVGGFMHFWNLTIDTVSCNNLIIAIGLCVDYSAHIAHRFLLEPGDNRYLKKKTRQIKSYFCLFWRTFFVFNFAEFWLVVSADQPIRSFQNSKKFAKKAKIWFDDYFFENTSPLAMDGVPEISFSGMWNRPKYGF